MNQPQPKQTLHRESDTPLLDKMLAEGVTYKPFLKDAEIHLTGELAYAKFATATKKGFLPTIGQVVDFLKTCESKKLDPFDRDAFLIGYDTDNGPMFNTITAHQAFLKRADAHEHFNGMRSGVIVRPIVTWDGDQIGEVGPITEREGDFYDPQEVLLGGWAIVYRKDREVPCYRRARLSVYSTGLSRWAKDPAGMICKVAEADALRSSFPNQLGGLHIAEEFHANELKAKERAPITMPEATEKPRVETPETEVIAGPPPQERDWLKDHDRLANKIEEGKILQEVMAEQLDDTPVETPPEPVKSPIMSWAEALAKGPDIETLNAWLPEIAELEAKDKAAVKKMINAYAAKAAWSILKGNKFYTPD